MQLLANGPVASQNFLLLLLSVTSKKSDYLHSWTEYSGFPVLHLLELLQDYWVSVMLSISLPLLVTFLHQGLFHGSQCSHRSRNFHSVATRVKWRYMSDRKFEKDNYQTTQKICRTYKVNNPLAKFEIPQI